MAKNHERILELHSLLSKLLDSLCFQICVNRQDKNCLSLLQILVWRRKNQIDDIQFLQLYRGWLESKSVFDITTCKQIQVYPKNQLICQEMAKQNFMNPSQINKALEKLNDAYNQFYKQKKPVNMKQLQQTQKIFSYLDPSGYIHLRLSSIFILNAGIIILQRLTIPLNFQSFKIHMNDLRKQLCEINGVVSLRCFKNYILNLNSLKRTHYLDNLMGVFSEIACAVHNDRNGDIPNVFDEVFNKWKSFPRFNSSDNKKNLQIYKRVFQQNQSIFYDERSNIQYFLQKYGEEFVKCFQIDTALLRQFNVLLKQTLNRYIEMFSKVAHKLNSKIADKSNNLVTTHRKNTNSQLSQGKPLQKTTSMKDKTPTKSHKQIEYRNKTPTKSYNQQSEIRKQFGSAQKIKSNTNAFRQITPTKSYRLSQRLHQSQANTTQKNAIKLGVQKDSFYNKMMFFRNKRVESYEIVMKRLKNK